MAANRRRHEVDGGLLMNREHKQRRRVLRRVEVQGSPRHRDGSRRRNERSPGFFRARCHARRSNDVDLPRAEPASTQAGSAGPTLVPGLNEVTNVQLLRWMFSFLKPVKPLAFIACLYLAAWVGTEVLAVRQSGIAVNQIQILHENANATSHGVWNWIFGANDEAARAAHAVPCSRRVRFAASRVPVPAHRRRDEAQHDDGLLHPRSGVRQTAARRLQIPRRRQHRAADQSRPDRPAKRPTVHSELRF